MTQTMILDLSRYRRVIYVQGVIFHQKDDLEVHPQLCLCGQGHGQGKAAPAL
jgi:hypothetical protein